MPHTPSVVVVVEEEDLRKMQREERKGFVQGIFELGGWGL